MPKTAKSNRLFLSRSQLALAFGVTPLTVTKWRAAGMPVHDRGARGRESRYDLAAVVKWEIERRVQARGGGSREPIDLGHERAGLARAQARRTMLDVQTREGKLLPRDQVVREGKAFVLAVRAHLLALPRRLVQMGHVPPERQPAVMELIHVALGEMSAWQTQLDLLAAAKDGDNPTIRKPTEGEIHGHA